MSINLFGAKIECCHNWIVVRIICTYYFEIVAFKYWGMKNIINPEWWPKFGVSLSKSRSAFEKCI